MSRVGRRPIAVPEGVEVSIQAGTVTAKGPRGELSLAIHPDMALDLSERVLTVSRPTEHRRHRSLHGLTRSLLANLLRGVSEGFQKGLELQGVGYRASKSGEKLVLQLGYSHPVEINPPDGITFTVEGTNRVLVSGVDKELVGGVASWVRAVRPPDAYLGKGVRYVGERVRRKAGKSGRVGRRK